MAITWLYDRPNLDNLSVSIKKRSKKGEEGYSITTSKSLKELILSEGYTHMRIGYEKPHRDTITLAFQMNMSGEGIELLNEKGIVKLWFDVTDYIKQISAIGFEIGDIDLLKVTPPKNNILISEAFEYASYHLGQDLEAQLQLSSERS